MACSTNITFFTDFARQTCAGHGNCTITSCICDTGYGGEGDWYEVDSCHVNISGLYIAQWVCYVITAITIVALTYRLATLRPLIVCKSRKNMTVYENRMIFPQLITLISIFSPSLMIVYLYLSMFMGYYMNSSLTLNIIFIVLTATWQTTSALVYRWLISTSSRTIHAFDENSREMTKILIRFLISLCSITTVVCCGFLIAFIFAKPEYKIMCARGYIICMWLSSIAHIFPAYYTNKLHTMIVAHLRVADTLDVNSHDMRHSRLAVEKIKKLRDGFFSTVVYLVMIIFSIVPEWMPYQVIFTFYLGALSGLMSFTLFSTSVIDAEESRLSTASGNSRRSASDV